MPVFTHVLMLRKGRVLASGPRETTLASRLLGQTFDAKVTLRRPAGRYQLTIQAQSRAVC